MVWELSQILKRLLFTLKSEYHKPEIARLRLSRGFFSRHLCRCNVSIVVMVAKAWQPGGADQATSHLPASWPLPPRHSEFFQTQLLRLSLSSSPIQGTQETNRSFFVLSPLQFALRRKPEENGAFIYTHLKIHLPEGSIFEDFANSSAPWVRSFHCHLYAKLLGIIFRIKFFRPSCGDIHSFIIHFVGM